MSTRGNVIFLNSYLLKEEYELSEEDISKIFSYEYKELIDKSPCIYIHSDMYPEDALRDLQEFLTMDASKYRAEDTSYLSAWFVAFKCMNLIPFARVISERKRLDYTKIPKTFDEMKKTKDFIGIGLVNGPDDWNDYQYIVIPKEIDRYIHESENSFDIYVFAGFRRCVGKFNTEENTVEEFLERVDL